MSKRIEDWRGRVRGYFCLSGPHDFISLGTSECHNPALPMRFIPFIFIYILEHLHEGMTMGNY